MNKKRWKKHNFDLICSVFNTYVPYFVRVDLENEKSAKISRKRYEWDTDPAPK